MANGSTGTTESQHTISIEREVDAPARDTFRCWVENTFLHPDHILKRTADRMVRFTYMGKDAPDSVAEIEFETKGANGCLVRVKHSQIGDATVARVLEQKWADELDALAVHAADKQGIPTLEIRVWPGPNPKPGFKN